MGHVDAAFLERVRDTFEPLKRRTYELMRLEDGHAVLDLGCGPASDTLALAEIVGQRGSVVGVDCDETMVQLANEKALRERKSARVRHVCADAACLPFDNRTFNASRSERVFQHLTDPKQALMELVRVTRSGGRVVIADPDFCGLSLDTQEIETERRLLHAMADVQHNGYAAVRTYRMMKEEQFRRVDVEVVPIVFRDYQVLRSLLRARIDTVLQRAGIGVDAFLRLERDLEERDAQGVLFGYVSMVITVGECA
jgi:ubiquinone/menaquinone biosynthesis C-methylase UbiE